MGHPDTFETGLPIAPEPGGSESEEPANTSPGGAFLGPPLRDRATFRWVPCLADALVTGATSACYDPARRLPDGAPRVIAVSIDELARLLWETDPEVRKFVYDKADANLLLRKTSSGIPLDDEPPHAGEVHVPHFLLGPTDQTKIKRAFDTAWGRNEPKMSSGNSYRNHYMSLARRVAASKT